MGAASASSTLILDWLGIIGLGADACSKQSPLAGVAGLVFLMLCTRAGWITVREEGSKRRAAVAGLLVASISASGALMALPLELAIMASAGCPTTGDPGLKGLALALSGGVLVVATVVASAAGLGVGAVAGAVGGIVAEQQKPYLGKP